MPDPLRRDLRFILDGQASAAPVAGRRPGLIGSARAVVPGKVALLIALGAGGLALLGRPYGVEDEPAPARLSSHAAPAVPVLIPLGRDSGVTARPTDPGVLPAPAPRAAPRRAPAPTSAAMDRGYAPVAPRAPIPAGDRIVVRQEVPSVEPRRLAPPPSRADAVAVPATLRLAPPLTPDPPAGMAAAPTARPTPPPTGKPGPKEARRQAIEDMRHLRYGW